MIMSCRQWTIAARPVGRALRESDFRLDQAEARAPLEGEVLVATDYLSFDPAQKSWIEGDVSYRKGSGPGGAMPGSGLGRVVESRHPAFQLGDHVHGPLGWRELAVVDGAELEKARTDVPLTANLSILGATGLTAYVGLANVGKPRPGDVVVISGAAGATGSVVGQIAKLAGCHVVGIAGGPEKCAWLTSELGFDGAIDYKNERVRHRLRELCPGGIDVMWDNVGGEILNDCLARIAKGARVVICGGISRYQADPRDPGQMPPGPRNYFNVVFTGATIQGFLMNDFEAQYETARARLVAWVQSGALRYKEDVIEGFENAPRALMRLFEGANFGKQILRLRPAT
jgi:NADPH-dependent curcumin reductase CurA